jgi:Tannase and feruloyl esterase/3HB-oligomer hydrolase (3HBOH)
MRAAATRPAVPGAQEQRAERLADLTTAATPATGHTVAEDWANLHAADTADPASVPGVQIDGYFPSATGFNPHHGWNHDAQFVIRLPDAWNGGLVVTAAPGVRRQYATDRLIGDWALAAGYAYAATDKGNSGLTFHTGGGEPGDTMAEWDRRLHELALAARETVRRRYGTDPRRTYVTGVSNGGFLTRRQLELHPDVYDGGVDCEGPLWRAQGPNLLTYLPAILAAYPAYRDTQDPRAHARLLAAGLPAGSEFLWEVHHQYYWDFTQRTYRAIFDPGYPGPGLPPDGIAFAPPGAPGSDADYDYAARPAAVAEAVARIELTGAIGKPLLSLHGTLDVLLPITLHADAYAALVREAGRGDLHRLYRIEGANHVDGFCDYFPGQTRPLLPFYRETFRALERWVQDGQQPPPSATVAWERPDPA